MIISRAIWISFAVGAALAGALSACTTSDESPTAAAQCYWLSNEGAGWVARPDLTDAGLCFEMDSCSGGGGLSGGGCYEWAAEADAPATEVGQVGGLGEGEQIYSVRFVGDVGYVVTFRQTDPLFVVDLSDPTAPVLRGELEIPGYSAYLHPIDEGHLLGVGQDADPAGMTRGLQASVFYVTDPAAPAAVGELELLGYSAYLHPIGDNLLLGIGQDATAGGQTTGTQLSPFDVSDPAQPTRLQQTAIPGASSAAEYDHHDGVFDLP